MSNSTPHFNGLTPAELERLAILAEEAGEIVQAVNKIIRHGYESYNPNIPGAPTNREDLEREIGDFTAALQSLVNQGDLNPDNIEMYRKEKVKRVWVYLHHQPLPTN
jgi:NTP pyrophosphatase (non-canonical NTP hydrolase)